MDSLKFHPVLPGSTLLSPADGPSRKQVYGHFRGGPPTGWPVCGHLLPLWTSHAVRPSGEDDPVLKASWFYDGYQTFLLVFSLCLEWLFSGLAAEVDLKPGKMSAGKSFIRRRTARGGHGLRKFSPGPAMSGPLTPCGRAMPEPGCFRGGPSTG
jgi:hypothetical protein